MLQFNVIQTLAIFCVVLSLVGSGEAAQRDRFQSVAGSQHSIPAPQAKATVLIFVSSTCPIANGYAPEINRLTVKFEPHKIEIFLVHTEEELTQEQAEEHKSEYGYECRVLMDPKLQLVKQTGATITPEAAVLSPSGKLLYRGRIDDRFPDIGIQRKKPTKTELRDAMEALLAGKPIPVTRTKAIGCYIE